MGLLDRLLNRKTKQPLERPQAKGSEFIPPRFPTHFQLGWAVVSIDLSHNGQYLASGGSSLGVALIPSDVNIWDVQSGQNQVASHAKVAAGSSPGINSVAFSADDQILAAAHIDGSVQLWDVAKAQMIRVLRGHQAQVVDISFSKDGRFLSSIDDDGDVKLWDAVSWEERTAFPGHVEQDGLVIKRNGTAIKFSPDGLTLAIGGINTQHPPEGGNLKYFGIVLLDVATGHQQLLNPIPKIANATAAVAFSPNGQMLAASGVDASLRIWDIVGRQERFSLPGHRAEVCAVAFSPNGQLLVSGAFDKRVKLWDSNTGQLLATLEVSPWKIQCVAFSPDGKTLAAGGFLGVHRTNKGMITSWDVTSYEAPACTADSHSL